MGSPGIDCYGMGAPGTAAFRVRCLARLYLSGVRYQGRSPVDGLPAGRVTEIWVPRWVLARHLQSPRSERHHHFPAARIGCPTNSFWFDLSRYGGLCRGPRLGSITDRPDYRLSWNGSFALVAIRLGALPWPDLLFHLFVPAACDGPYAETPGGLSSYCSTSSSGGRRAPPCQRTVFHHRKAFLEPQRSLPR